MLQLFSDKNVYTLHKWFGLISGLFLLMLSLTGIILLYDESLDRMFNPGLTQVAPAGDRLSPDSLLNVVKKQFPTAKIGGLLLQTQHPNWATVADVSEGKKRLLVHQNPYTGAVLGSRENDKTLHRQILKIHEHLTIGPWGHFILFIVGLCFIGLVVTGLWYYRRSLFGVYKVGIRKTNTYIYNADLHKLTGVSIFLFLLVMGGTGTFMHWEKVERLFGEEEGERRRPEAPIMAPETKATASTEAYTLETLIQKASAEVPNFVPQFVAMPREPQDPIAIRGSRPESKRILGKFNTEVSFDSRNGKLLEVKHKEDGDFEANLEASIEQIHFGKYGGWISQLIYALGSLGLAIMAFTGYVIWLRKGKKS
jgi:uncharacterized iron-regulated membrane protein